MSTHRLIPPFILEQYSAGKHSGSFPAVSLFVDISGFSSMTDTLMAHGQHGAEVLAEIMRSVLDPLIESVYAQGGFVAASAGDALTALFPVHENAQDEYLQALAAAMQIQQLRQAQELYVTPYQAFHISARVGLAAGEVDWGIVLSKEGRRGAFYFRGAAIDGCAAAEHQARAGQVIVDAALLAQVKDCVVVEPTGPYALLQQVAGALPEPQPVHLPAPDLNVMRCFFPEAVLSQSLSGEFRQVVSMFISLPSVRTETQLHIFMESLFALQEKYGGLLNRLDFGDKGTNLLLFWGAPAAYENDIERALSFILELQVLTSIPISAGVTYRISHAGFIGGRLHEEYTCFGRGVNLAARFMTSAPRGEIWVDEAIARRAGNRFEIEFVREGSFKGFQQAQKFFVLLERKAEAASFFSSQFTGRENDLAVLSHFTGPIYRQEYAGMLVISGEPGIGKSRLVYEFLQSLQKNQPGEAQVCIGQTDELLRQSLNPFEYWLRRYFGAPETQGEARNKRSFNRKLDELITSASEPALAEELDRTRSLLGAMLDLHWPDSLYEQLDAQGRYKNTFIGLATLLKLESRRLPLILVLEDIHQFDDDSQAFLAYLNRQLSAPEGAPYPVAILATSRTAELPFVEAACEANCRHLPLQGLDRQGLQALALAQLGGPLGNHLLNLLAARAEGNPFYAEQILYFLKDEGLLVQAAEKWELDQDQLSALPADVNALLVARLDHLTREVKEVVQAASVLGREFEIQLLNHMQSGNPSDAPSEEVLAAEREAIWAPLDATRYLFKHILMRDAAYQMQVHTRRQALHRLALAAYEQRYAARLPERYGELAYHAEQAGLTEKAVDYLRLAGSAAFEAFQNSLAIDYFSRALTLLAAPDLEKRFALLVARLAAYERVGDNTARQRDLSAIDALRPLLNDVQKTVEILLSHARYAIDTGNYPAADTLAREAAAQSLAHVMQDLAAAATILLSMSTQRQGKQDLAAVQAQEGLRLAREAHSVRDEIRALNILGLTATGQGQLEAGRQHLTRCMQLAEQVGDWRTYMASLNNLGQICGMQGDYSAAQAYYQQCIKLSQKMGERVSEAIVTGNLGFISIGLGEYARARALIEQYLRIAREAGQPYYEVNALVNLSACTGALAEHENAGQYALRALELAQKINDRSGEAWALTYLGHSLLAAGDPDGAMAAYTRALMIRQELNQPDLATEPAAGLARGALQRHDIALARDTIAPILEYLHAGKDLDSTDQPLRVYLTCYLVLEETGDPRKQELLAAGHYMLQERLSKITDVDTRQAFLSNIEHHREIQAAWLRAQA